TCRNFETISSGFGRLFAIRGPPFPKHSGGTAQLGRLNSVLGKFANTFLTLCSLADFSADAQAASIKSEPSNDQLNETIETTPGTKPVQGGNSIGLGGIHYNIQIVLPASRDPKVFDALFRSLKEHLID
ncbi:hypothetical protein ABLN87_19875, partial [Ruegeria sp. SCPT10]|uniref:hypothetical protein n=1 Tax=Ruegeria sp. SCP10 TaxID=3141377 RepID=UPI00333A7DDF